MNISNDLCLFILRTPYGCAACILRKLISILQTEILAITVVTHILSFSPNVICIWILRYNVLIVKMNCSIQQLQTSLRIIIFSSGKIWILVQKTNNICFYGCIVNRFLKTPLLILLPDTHLDHVQTLWQTHTELSEGFFICLATSEKLVMLAI
jgi:hypothetical protein